MWKCSRAQNILFKNLQCQILHLGKIRGSQLRGSRGEGGCLAVSTERRTERAAGWTRGKPSVWLGFNYRKVNDTDCCWSRLELSMDHYAKVSNPPKQRFTSVTYKPFRTYVRLSRCQKGGVIQGKEKKNNWGPTLEISHSHYFYSRAEIQVKANNLVVHSK